ncbi:sugar phosphate isomerase/epimerase family protein [Gimesia algae]|uniref:Xylose isomerase-like TIM barrel n=1 Tax=Gimesia algae TaxID=2527971 RepID=A0A517VCQ8_9PLAN|nr:TIM barrel protein [Gimesia algae]QDT90787.1 Xylose isomerase-like TIM barrel [Gimesia algae]
MSDNPRVILSAFADEAANHKTAVEQMVALSALGLRYYSPRFIDVNGDGNIKHVVDLNKSEYKSLLKMHDEYGINVTSIGARVGKIKLVDKDDGSHNVFVPFKEYLKKEVTNTINAATTLGTKLIRGFSFYPPKGEDAKPYMSQAVDQIGQIVDLCAKEGLVYGLEIEPNLIGETGPLLAELARKVNRPNMVTIYDGGNIAAQNKDAMQCLSEFNDMKKSMGWLHIKDYAVDKDLEWTGVVDEERLKNFVPANVGDAGHEVVLRELREMLPKMEKKMKKLGVPGVFLEVEPHLKGGGQFGGFSGPDGIGVAVRALCSVLDYVGIDYDLRTFKDIQELRGF